MIKFNATIKDIKRIDLKVNKELNKDNTLSHKTLFLK
jgi:hypothetical protein